jgi:hypothetical protein
MAARQLNLDEMYLLLKTELASAPLGSGVLLEMPLGARFLKRVGHHGRSDSDVDRMEQLTGQRWR